MIGTAAKAGGPVGTSGAEAAPAESLPLAPSTVEPDPAAMRPTHGAEERDVTEAPGGQAQLLVPGLFCALALFISLALVGLQLALAIVVLIAAAVLLPMRWWMPALAAVALGLALAIQSGGGRTDEVAVMLVAFVLVAGALLLYEVWGQLHSRLQT